MRKQAADQRTRAGSACHEHQKQPEKKQRTTTMTAWVRGSASGFMAISLARIPGAFSVGKLGTSTAVASALAGALAASSAGAVSAAAVAVAAVVVVGSQMSRLQSGQVEWSLSQGSMQAWCISWLQGSVRNRSPAKHG
jgi:hypothetical protein